ASRAIARRCSSTFDRPGAGRDPSGGLLLKDGLRITQGRPAWAPLEVRKIPPCHRLAGLQQNGSHRLRERTANTDSAHARISDLLEAQAADATADHVVDRDADRSTHLLQGRRV